jgi:hypothetical protein
VLTVPAASIGGTGSGFSVPVSFIYGGGANSAHGYQSLFNTTISTGNSSFGYQSGYGITSGSYNITLGYQSGYGLTGSYNTALGYQSGNVITGSTNTVLGYQSGNLITSGNRNVIIGSYSGAAAPINATGSNFIVLSDGAGNVRQFIDSNGNVTIPASTAATSNTTGALVVTGGVGVGGNLYVAGSIVTAGVSGNISNVNVLSAVTILTTSNVGVGTATLSTGSNLAVYGGNIQIGSTNSGLKFPDGTFMSTAPSGGATLSDQTTTNANTFYPVLAINQTSGSLTTANTSSTKLYYNPSTGTFNANIFNSLSDVNKKTAIKTIDDSNTILDQIRGVRFNWRDNGQPSAGLIAQDVEAVMPELVNAAEDGTKSLNYNGIIGVLVETIKELRSEVKTLSAKVAVLESKSKKGAN